MPEFQSEVPITRGPSGQEFNEGHALSATTQPYLTDLFRILADQTQKVTFFVGAGVSIDAGYPGWSELIRLLSTRISEPRFGKLAAADSDGILRQAETVFRLIQPATPATDAEILREVLFRHHPQPKFGQLAEELARLALALGDRCSFITTNFDDVLESALAAQTDVQPEAFSLKNDVGEDDIEAPLNLEEYPGFLDWSRRREEIGPRAVMHLHGMTRRRADPLRPLILTESHFLRYGGAVRQLVLSELRDRVVVFIGAGLNDPDVTGPLWDLKQYYPDDKVHAFALHVPGSVDGAEDVHEARSYGIAKYKYLEAALGVCPIFLKSYSQLLQLLIEASLCVGRPDEYLDRNGESPLAYGERFERILERCYTATIGEPSGHVAPGAMDHFELRVDVSRRLQRMLEPEGAVGKLLRSPPPDVALRHRQLRHKYDDFKVDPSDEHFGLFLWLRTPAPLDGRAAPYALDLVATSSYTHYYDWSARRTALIEGNSGYPAARAVFAGAPKLMNLPLMSPAPIWRSALALPLKIAEAAEPDGEVVVGALTLNSSFLVDFRKRERGPVSVLAAVRDTAEYLDESLILSLRTQISDVLLGRR